MGGEGCSYNSHPVFTSLPCPSSPPSMVPSPTPPSPSPPPPSSSSPPATGGIPADGVLVLSGGSTVANPVGCLMPGVDDDKMVWPGSGLRYDTIAAQCCTAAGECRRSIRGQCVAGNSRTLNGAIEMFTYAKLEEFCTANGLELCTQSCAGEGCSYNSHPVFTSLPCPSPPPSMVPSPTPPSPSPPPPSSSSPPATGGIPADGVLVLSGGST